MKHTDFSHYVIMFFIMLISGLLSTMNVWADKLDDIRISVNDIYMILLMNGWMFFFMGLYYGDISIVGLGLVLVIINIWCIRTQFMVTDSQFVLGMIPHHSMAVHMSKKLIERGSLSSSLKDFASGIIKNQEQEIDFMKKLN